MGRGRWITHTSNDHRYRHGTYRLHDPHAARSPLEVVNEHEIFRRQRIGLGVKVQRVSYTQRMRRSSWHNISLLGSSLGSSSLLSLQVLHQKVLSSQLVVVAEMVHFLSGTQMNQVSLVSHPGFISPEEIPIGF